MPDTSTPEPDEAVYAERCRARIADRGHMVAAIDADPGDGTPAYAYTIGVSPRGHEFAVSGLPVEDMHNTLNRLARRSLAGELDPRDGLMIEGVFERGYLPCLRLAHPGSAFKWIELVLGVPHRPPVWQAQYPDLRRRYPGQPGYDPSPYRQTDFTSEGRDHV